jgi:hypothetical protein
MKKARAAKTDNNKANDIIQHHIGHSIMVQQPLQGELKPRLNQLQK